MTSVRGVDFGAARDRPIELDERCGRVESGLVHEQVAVGLEDAQRIGALTDAVKTAHRSLDELRGSEGMDRIKLAVGKKLDDLMGVHRVRSVFITELVIQ